MKYRTILIVLGALVVIMPVLRFPSSWHDPLYVILGLLIIGAAYAAGKKAGPKVEA